MSGFTKLFDSIVGSTIWQEPDHTRLVWITMMAKADQDGVVDASVPGLAHFANVPIGACEQALATLLAPDKYSRTPDHEGRRIEAYNDGQRSGWILLNHSKYREARNREERKAYNREWMAKKRAEDKSPQKSTVDDCGQSGPQWTQAEAEADTEAKSKSKAKAGAKKSNVSRGTRLPSDWQPTEADVAYATSQQVEAKIESEKFKDWWAAAAGAKGVKLDWSATWRTWVRRADKTLSAPSTAKLGSKAALEASESPMDKELARIRHDQHLGVIDSDEMIRQLRLTKQKYGAK